MGRRRPLTHALRVTESCAAFRPLFDALVAAGERGGWLELEGAAPSSDDAAMPERRALDGPLRAGVWKAVALSQRRSVAVKSRRGPPVLRDLLREHFRGCRVVLVRETAVDRAPRGDTAGGDRVADETALPSLAPQGDDWELRSHGGDARRLTTAQLLAALRAPRLPV